MAQKSIIIYRLLIPWLQPVTIVVSDAKGEMEGSKHGREDSEWDHIDNYETPGHQVGLRTRRMGRGGYREVVSELED